LVLGFEVILRIDGVELKHVSCCIAMCMVLETSFAVLRILAG
jgi:hypothetical protein